MAALYDGIQHNDLLAVEEALRIPIQPDAFDPSGFWTPLVYAANWGLAAVTRLLCEANASLKRMANNQYTAQSLPCL